ncbi:CBS domain-containing protein CBSX5-like [Rutidosis leptorrhynchoides]|uniref:CBS domain-containing protein CBSX5-like n=1 Tax=Rutidosis leptorrhynchoides TaxID=125765 RepID=UPI003A994998
MAVSLLSHEVSDLCLGKPSLRSLSVSATIGDALTALKRSGENSLSVWNCVCSRRRSDNGNVDSILGECKEFCECVGKICMVDVVCFLGKEENLKNPISALQSPISVLISNDSPGLVRHLRPHTRVWEAIAVILDGAQNLVIPLKSRNSTRRKLVHNNSINSSTVHNNREYCWLTVEDIIRYLLNSIGLFSPISVQPINALNLIDTENVLSIHYHDPASSILPLIHKSLINQTSVAIIDEDGKILGEISTFVLNYCDESVAAAIATLSAGDLMAFIDCGGPPEDLIQLVKERLEERNLKAALELMEEDSSGMSSSSSAYNSSSDEECSPGSGKIGRSGGYSSRVGRRSEAIVCYPWSSLVAVMIQALSHRVSYVWVVEEDGSLAGIVTFAGMLKVFQESLKAMS